MSEQFIEDFQYAYAYVLIEMVYNWIHHNDGSVNYTNTGLEKTKTLNKNITVKYVPLDSGNMDWYEDAIITITPTEESGVKMNSKLQTKLKLKLYEVEDKFMESVNGTIKKAGVWMKNYGNKDFLGFASITDNVKFIDGKLTIKYNIIDYDGASTHEWLPKELVQWFYVHPSHKRRMDPKVKKIEEEYILSLTEYKKKIEENPDCKEAKMNLRSLECHIEEMTEQKFYCYGVEPKYMYDENEMEQWKDHYGSITTDLVEMKDAFPNRKQVSGVKRKRE